MEHLLRNSFTVLIVSLLSWTGQTNGSQGFNLKETINKLKIVSANLTESVTSYQSYIYDSYRFPMTFIRDGGDDLFDNGNMAKFYEDRRRHNLRYNNTIMTQRYNISALAINPFIALAAIHTTEGKERSYTFRVSGDLGADGRGYVANMSGQVLDEIGRLDYHSFQVYKSGDPTLCEVYFLITSQRINSRPPELFDVVRFSTSTRVTDNMVRIFGNIQNVYFGYTVLSRGDGEIIPMDDVNAVMKIILKASLSELDATTPSPISATVVPSTKPRVSTREAKSRSSSTIGTSMDVTLDDLIWKFQQASYNITNAIENFHYYDYDTFRYPMNVIRDGGNDMYDSGNLVKFIEDDTMEHLMYNRTIISERYEITTRSIHPFVTLALIKNPENEEHVYRIRVTGDIGADGAGNISLSEGKLMDGNGFLKFYTFQVHNSGDPTVCEVYFTISNTDWNSSVEDNFSVVMLSKAPRFLNNEVMVNGRPRNIVFGYTLFSKADSNMISEAEITAAMKIILRSTLSAVSVAVGPLTKPRNMKTSPGLNSGAPARATSPQTTQTTRFITTASSVTTEITLEEIWRRANNVQNAIGTIVSSFFYYAYDDIIRPNNSINDGGSDMFDGGNMVKIFPENNEPIDPFEYNTKLRFPSYDVTLGGNRHPFMTLAWIRNEEGSQFSYSIKVEGNLGADGSGDYATNHGSFENADGFVRYAVFQVYGAKDPSVCEVYFAITRQEWASSENTEFDMTHFERTTNAISTIVQLSGAPQNMLIGYALLSRLNGEAVTNEQVREFLSVFLTEISTPETNPGIITSAIATNTTFGGETKMKTVNTDAVVAGETTTQVIAKPTASIQSAATTSTNFTTDTTNQLGIPSIDEEFLPSCTVKGFILSIFRCERIFQKRTIYTGPASCRAKLDETVRCVGTQLLECRKGAGRYVLDSYNLPFFNSETMVMILYNATQQLMIHPSFAINSFCHHAGLNLPYPHINIGNIPGCELETVDRLLSRAKTLYYRYAWARNGLDICRAFQDFKSWFLETVSISCDFEEALYEVYPPSTARYLNNVARIVLETFAGLEISACSGSRDAFALDQLGIFANPSNAPCTAS